MTPRSLFQTLTFFLKFLGSVFVLVAWGQCLKAGTIMSKNTEWGTGVLGVRENIKLSSYVNLFEKKKGNFCTIFFFLVALSGIKLLFFLSLGRASTRMLYLSKRQKCSSIWEDLEEYRISISRGLLDQIFHLLIKSASFTIWLTLEKKMNKWPLPWLFHTTFRNSLSIFLTAVHWYRERLFSTSGWEFS